MVLSAKLRNRKLATPCTNYGTVGENMESGVLFVAYAQTAVKQIKEKKYPESLLQYTGDILLVGINYDPDNKKHECLIEKYKKE